MKGEATAAPSHGEALLVQAAIDSGSGDECCTYNMSVD
jgi:hypothetical protein